MSHSPCIPSRSISAKYGLAMAYFLPHLPFPLPFPFLFPFPSPLTLRYRRFALWSSTRDRLESSTFKPFFSQYASPSSNCTLLLTFLTLLSVRWWVGSPRSGHCRCGQPCHEDTSCEEGLREAQVRGLPRHSPYPLLELIYYRPLSYVLSYVDKLFDSEESESGRFDDANSNASDDKKPLRGSSKKRAESSAPFQSYDTFLAQGSKDLDPKV